MNQSEKSSAIPDRGEQQRQYWNIVKGIGIILVVAGHACNSSVGTPVSNYIYLFHLPLFFFVSGYLYNEEKYGDDPYANIASRLKSSWIKYVLIYWVLILLHDTMLGLQMLEESAVLYSKTEMLRQMAYAVLGMGHEMMGGTLWFVPVIVMSSSLLGMIVSVSRILYRYNGRKWMKYMFQFLVILLCAGAGYILEYLRIDLAAHMQIVLVVMPFLWAGYLLRKRPQIPDRIFNLPVSVLCAVILLLVSRKYTLDLVFQIVYPYMHAVAFLGIYICLTAAKYIQRRAALKSLFALYGKASFWVMFLHFPVLKLFDWVYAVYLGNGDLTQYRLLPVSYTQFWPIYLVLGLSIPVVMFSGCCLFFKNRGKYGRKKFGKKKYI